MQKLESSIINSDQDTYIREVRVNYHSTGTRKFAMTDPADVADFVRSVLPDNSREHFVALYLDGSNHVACYSLVSTGTANQCVAHPREVFQRALVTGAVAIILAHNHPSGKLNPSNEDLQVTQRLKEGANLLGIKLLDHLIVSDHGFESILVP